MRETDLILLSSSSSDQSVEKQIVVRRRTPERVGSEAHSRGMRATSPGEARRDDSNPAPSSTAEKTVSGEI